MVHEKIAHVSVGGNHFYYCLGAIEIARVSGNSDGGDQFHIPLEVGILALPECLEKEGGRDDRGHAIDEKYDEKKPR